MSRAFKCDKCRQYFDQDRYTSTRIYESLFRIVVEFRDYPGNNVVDLCPCCQASLIKEMAESMIFDNNCQEC